MATLADIDIKQLLESGALRIENFSDSSLDGASYDLRLGESYYVSNEKTPKKLSDGDVLSLEPNQFALVSTHEILELPTNLIGQVGLRSRYSLSGLMNISGLQVDPGFRGRLVLGIVNLSTKTRKISYLERIFTIQFHTLSKNSSKPYRGILLGVKGIPADFIEKLEDHNMPSHFELINRVEKLESLVKWVIIGGLGTVAVIVLQSILK